MPRWKFFLIDGDVKGHVARAFLLLMWIPNVTVHVPLEITHFLSKTKGD
jgi:hypothetical protein